MVPPERISHINEGDSEILGKLFFKHFVEVGGLKNSDRVLDVGSGFGRMAVPLTRFLNTDSHYEGIEIIARAADWCTKKITSRHPNFRFQKIDVLNHRYNPKGTVDASVFKFPFETESFDFVILTSVFTHMLPEDLKNYLSEISRVLKTGGTCFITYFLLNESSLDLIKKKKSHFKLEYSFENCRIESQDDPEHAIAYPENEVRDFYEKNKIAIKSVHYGNWSGRVDALDFQDIVIGERK